MNIKMRKIKWFAIILPALFVGIFEVLRHQIFGNIPTFWGNVMVSGVAALTGLLYYHGIFTFIQKLNRDLQEEKEEKAILCERDRIAHELHDSVAQALFFMNIKAKEIEQALEKGRSPFVEVSELRKAIKLTDADVRQHIFNLHMASQADVQFVSMIESYIDQFSEQSGIEVVLKVDGDMNQKLEGKIKNQLIRIFQEIFMNIRKHANTESVRVEIREENHHLLMVIEDKGIGFDLDRLPEQESTFGLKIVEERAHSIGAEVEIQSQRGVGTTVSLKLALT